MKKERNMGMGLFLKKIIAPIKLLKVEKFYDFWYGGPLVKTTG